LKNNIQGTTRVPNNYVDIEQKDSGRKPSASLYTLLVRPDGVKFYCIETRRENRFLK